MPRDRALALSRRGTELFSDVYAKLHVMGNANPNRAAEVKLWSKAALALRAARPNASAYECYRVEHGTPRREFARMVMTLYRRDALTEDAMAALVKEFWKLAVITLEEDARLNRVARSRCFVSPEKRWHSAGIRFPRKRI